MADDGVSVLKFLSLYLLFVLTIFTTRVSTSQDSDKQELKRERNQITHSSHRQLLEKSHYKTTQHDTSFPPTTTFPTTPEDNPAPVIVTVPGTSPSVTVTPNPASTPLSIPSTTPMPIVNPSAPVTNPVTTPSISPPGSQTVTNPVTTYPAPTTGVPATTPVTPAVQTGGASAVPGQGWCVAKGGVPESSLQAALDYACGIGGADCSGIQQGAGCFSPVTLQNHASYAFNSYYQKNPVQTSCDFGGVAMITNSNPSTGTCNYASSSSSSSSPTTATPMPTTITPSPMTTTTPPMTPSSFPGETLPGFGTPPSVLNTSNPASVNGPDFGDSPPLFNSSTSMATTFDPFIGCVVLVTSIVTGRFILSN